MRRDDKSKVLRMMTEKFEHSEAVFIVRQSRMTVPETEALRRRLAVVSSSYFVSKNTLARLAVDGGEFACLRGYFHGQTAVIFSNDVVGSAKVIHSFSSENSGKLSIVCAGYAGKVMDVADIQALAKLPSMLELKASFIAQLQAPMCQVALMLRASASQLVRIVCAYVKK